MLLWLVPFLLLGAARAVLAVHDVGVLAVVLGYVFGLGCVAVAIGVFLVTYRRGVRKLATAAGPGAWADRCVDVRRPEVWRAIVADAGGVRLVGDRSGTVVAAWPWTEIHDVRVEKAAVADRTGHVVVLEVGNGSTMTLAFLAASVLGGYPRRRAEAVARDLQRRALGGGTATSAALLPVRSTEPEPSADRAVPTPLPGHSGGWLQVRGYLLEGAALLVLLPSLPFESKLPGGARTELLTFIPVCALAFFVGCAIVSAGTRKLRREVDRGYTTDFQTAGWDQTLFLLDRRDLSVLSSPFQPRPDKLPHTGDSRPAPDRPPLLR
jgi:hypothetical protein